MAERLWLENYPVRWNLEYPKISLYEHIKQTTACLLYTSRCV